MRRRAELVLVVRAFAYGAIAASLLVTGAAGLVDGNTADIAVLVAGGIVGAMAVLFGYVASNMMRNPFPLQPSFTPGLGRFYRLRLVVLAISGGILGIFGLVAIVLALVELFRGRQFTGLIDAGIFLIAIASMAGVTAWARRPLAKTDNPW